MIVTRGAAGSLVFTRERVYEIPAAPAAAVVDPPAAGTPTAPACYTV